MQKFPISAISTGRAILVGQRHIGLGVQKFNVLVPTVPELLKLEEQFGGEFYTSTVTRLALEAAFMDWRKSAGGDFKIEEARWTPVDDGVGVPIPVLKKVAGSERYQILSGLESVVTLLTEKDVNAIQFPVLLWSKSAI